MKGKQVRRALSFLVAPMLLAACKPVLEITGFQEPQGAITIWKHGQFVDPYFAVKALLVVKAAGMEIRPRAISYILWQLPRQLPDGEFPRYCMQQHVWRACKPADADDALLALWVQLLYAMAPSTGVPDAWARSIARAEVALAKLRMPYTGVYYVSQINRQALFIDNVEVYSALKSIAADQKRLGYIAQAQQTIRDAARLATSINKVFWEGAYNRYRVTAGEEPMQPGRFYPDMVAEVYAIDAGLPPAPGSHAKTWKQWRHQYGDLWLEMKLDTYPWGLLALTAMRVRDFDTAWCWQWRAGPLRRRGRRWNVLEEVAFEAVSATRPPNKSPNCKGGA